jgi:hypothetical protein
MEAIKELAVTNALMDAYLILQDLKKLKTSLAMELQVGQQDRLNQARDFAEFMHEVRQTLADIRADNKIEAQLLNLIKPENGRVTDEKPRTGVSS